MKAYKILNLQHKTCSVFTKISAFTLELCDLEKISFSSVFDHLQASLFESWTVEFHLFSTSGCIVNMYINTALSAYMYTNDIEGMVMI